MDSVSLLRMQVKGAHDMLEGTIKDLTAEQAHFQPAGAATSAGANLAHIILAEDFFLNMVVGRTPLGTGAFAGKMGMSEPPPMGGDWTEWAGRVKVDLPALRTYGQAVFKSTDEYLASLKPDDLDKEVDLSMAGMGKQKLGSFLTTIGVVHGSNHCGEISCLKGMQGSKGYSF